ncbi:MAG: carbohydrate-binding domain-containing protein [Tenericutes bacterium]|nr:carbohydrate-binding domain-containing protein [Mycoplasmatota bacterium]
MKKLLITILFIAFALTLTSCNTSGNEDYTTTLSTEATYSIEVIDLGDVTYENYEEEERIVLDVSSEAYNITEAGSYILRGTITETVTINVGEDEDVRLILDNVTIVTELNSAILVLSADDVEISVPDGTVNYLEDSVNYSETYQDYNSALYSEADLLINGTGTLNVQANYNNGISTKDDLIIVDVTLNVISVDDGIIGRDSLSIQNATIELETEGDGLKTTFELDDDSEEVITDKGYVNIISGTITIYSDSDGIDATNNIVIDGGTLNITSNSKGIKSDIGLYINDGIITIDSSDDAIHVDINLEVAGGLLTISTNDDGLHSEAYLTISGGTINILDSFEGIEGKYIYITGGTMDIFAEDDGINGSDPKIDIADALRPNETPDEDLSTAIINISGGVILIESEDDSIDSNGIINISGGIIVINGPTSGMQSMIDYDLKWTLTGGTIIAVSGYGNETKIPSSSSTQISLLYNTGTTQSAGTTVSLLDEDDNVIIAFTPTKRYQAIFITTPDLDDSTTYTFCLGGDVSGELVNRYYTDAEVTGSRTVDTFKLNSITNKLS